MNGFCRVDKAIKYRVAQRKEDEKQQSAAIVKNLPDLTVENEEPIVQALAPISEIEELHKFCLGNVRVIQYGIFDFFQEKQRSQGKKQ